MLYLIILTAKTGIFGLKAGKNDQRQRKTTVLQQLMAKIQI
jgi:hypothetical protein